MNELFNDKFVFYNSRFSKVWKFKAFKDLKFSPNERDCFCSLQFYDKNTNLKFVRFVIDLDNKDDFSLVTKDARKIIDFLFFHKPKGYYNLYFSGSKGLHIEFNDNYIKDIKFDDYTHLKYIKFMEYLIEKLNLKTVDFAPYKKRSLFRIENTKHSKTNLYKTKFEYSDLTNNLDYFIKNSEIKKSKIINDNQNVKFKILTDRINKIKVNIEDDFEFDISDVKKANFKILRKFDEYCTVKCKLCGRDAYFRYSTSRVVCNHRETCGWSILMEDALELANYLRKKKVK